jgi:hypothetical protein
MRIFSAGVLLLALAFPVPAVSQSSPARAAQDVFDVRNKESDYFEHVFRGDAGLAADSYSGALRFARCVGKLDPAGLSSVVAADAGSGAEDGAIRSLARRYKNCAVRRDSIPALVMRGAIAETIWKQSGADPNPGKRSSVDVADVANFVKAEPLGEMAVKVAGTPLSSVSRCQVMALPDQSAKVLATEPGSSEEKAEADALYVGSRVCGVQKALDRIPSVAVRAALADAFYQDSRRATATAPR